MDIIYTYKSPIYKIPNRDRYQKEWLELSINSAKKVGYRTVLYTNTQEISKNLDIDELQIVECKSKLWDSLKIKVLETRHDNNYFLSDYDIEYYSNLNIPSNIDIVFDAIEDDEEIWNRVYKQPVDVINRLGINRNSGKIPVFNVGILKINNTQLKNKYTSKWRELEILTDKLNLDPVYLTAALTQYILTTLVTEETTTLNYSGTNLGLANEFYHHYNGSQKIKKIRGEVLF